MVLSCILIVLCCVSFVYMYFKMVKGFQQISLIKFLKKRLITHIYEYTPLKHSLFFSKHLSLSRKMAFADHWSISGHIRGLFNIFVELSDSDPLIVLLPPNSINPYYHSPILFLDLDTFDYVTNRGLSLHKNNRFYPLTEI